MSKKRFRYWNTVNSNECIVWADEMRVGRSGTLKFFDQGQCCFAQPRGAWRGAWVKEATCAHCGKLGYERSCASCGAEFQD